MIKTGRIVTLLGSVMRLCGGVSGLDISHMPISRGSSFLVIPEPIDPRSPSRYKEIGVLQDAQLAPEFYNIHTHVISSSYLSRSWVQPSATHASCPIQLLTSANGTVILDVSPFPVEFVVLSTVELLLAAILGAVVPAGGAEGRAGERRISRGGASQSTLGEHGSGCRGRRRSGEAVAQWVVQVLLVAGCCPRGRLTFEA